MLNRIFPERIDNQYRSHKFALWAFVPITFLTVSRSVTHIFRSDGGAQSLSKIPLDTFVNGGAETVVWAFAYIGLSQLLLGLLFVLVLLRYRAMIPLTYVVYLAEYFGAKGIYLMRPYVNTTDTVGTIKFDTSLHRYTYLFGPQFNFYPNDKVKIFVHPLFGGVHDTTKTTIGTTTTDFSASAFAMAFGGGVDVNLNNHFAIRPIQFDYVPTHFGGNFQNNYRFLTEVVFRFGKR